MTPATAQQDFADAVRVPIVVESLTYTQARHLGHLRELLVNAEHIAQGHKLPALAAMLALCLEHCDGIEGVGR